MTDKETGTIFDLIEPELSTGKQGYMDLVDQAPSPKDNSFFTKVKEFEEGFRKKLVDYDKTVQKGLFEGISQFGRMMGPLQTFESEEELQKKQAEALDRYLPNEEGFGQRSLRRGLRQAPTNMVMPGAGMQMLPRSLAAGFMGEGAKELGLPEWAQTAMELTAYLGPDATKKLLAEGKHKDIIEAGRKMGLTDREITPLLQSSTKQKWLAKLTPKRGKTQTALEKTKAALGRAYDGIKQSQGAQAGLGQEGQQALFTSLRKEFFDMPANVRNTVAQDFKDLVSQPITGESLINFYKDINANLAHNTKQLSRLKEPIKNALGSISPELAQDFEMANQMYSKYSTIASKLKPNLVDDIVKAGEILGLGGSIFKAIAFGDPTGLMGLIGEQASRKLAQQMLFNPRLQQLTKKTIKAINENKWAAVKKLMDIYSNEIREDSPEIANQLEKLSLEDYEKLLNSNLQSKKQE